MIIGKLKAESHLPAVDWRENDFLKDKLRMTYQWYLKTNKK